MRSVSLAALGMLFASVAAACAASDVSIDEEDQGTAEQDLSTCSLGTACPTLAVLGGRAVDAPPAKRTRSDVRAKVLGNEVVPRILVQKTSRALKFAGGRAALSGSGDGTAPFFFDDFVLIEVLAVDGRSLNVGLISHEGHVVRVEGKEITPFTPLSPWLGENQGFKYDAGVIDLAALLPRDQPFKLRFTAFDTGGVGLVSDIHLRYSADAPSPPQGANDPWDPAYCTEPPLTTEKALAKFAAGTTWANLSREQPKVAIRTRHCEPLTGCAAWQASNKMLIGTFYQGNGYSSTTYRNGGFSIPVTSSAIDLQADNQRLWAWVYVNTDSGTLRLRKAFDGGFAWAIGWLVDFRGSKVEDPAEFKGVLGEHCMRAAAGIKDGTEEWEVVVFGRY